MMKRAAVGLGWILAILGLITLAGCVPRALSPAKARYLTSAATGCPPAEVKAEPREDPEDDSFRYWTAECRGRKFYCAYAHKYFGCAADLEATPQNPNTLQMPLPPSAMPAPAPVAPRPK